MHAMLAGVPDDAPIAFAWWPRADQWDATRIVERACRSIPACRPGIDLIALPDVPHVRALFATWANDAPAARAVRTWQALWYAPRVDDARAHLHALDAVLIQLRQRTVPGCALGVYVSFVDMAVRDRIARAGFRVVGDLDDHPVLQSLSAAKAWLHPTLTVHRESGAVDIGSTTAARVLASSGCRIPMGFVCATPTDRVEAHRRVARAMGASARVVMKPVCGMGCRGLVLDARPSDATSPTVTNAAIVEAFIPSRARSPAVYMCRGEVLAIVDQLMADGHNTGNICPTAQPSDAQARMVAACQAIHAALGVRGQWGADFIIDAEGVPVIVDLNMGRPLGSLGYLLWRSLQPAPTRTRVVAVGSPVDDTTTCMHMLVCERRPPCGQTVGELRETLRADGLLWAHGCAEGVVVMQHIPGQWSTTICASWQGDRAVHALYARLRSVDVCAIYRTSFTSVE